MGFSGSDAGGFQWDGFSSGAPSQSRPPKEKKSRKGVSSPVARVFIDLGVTLIFGLVFFYAELPALNLHAPEFYTFAFLLCAVYCICAIITSGFQGDGFKGYFKFLKKQCIVPLILVVLLFVTAIVGNIAGSVFFRAGAYSELLPFEVGTFSDDVDEIPFDQIPMLDKDSAIRLGDRKLGELSDMVSQFEVMEDYTQINYKGHPVRIASLQYADLIKWFTNRSDGLPAYLVIDMVTQKVELHRLPEGEGIRYTTAEHLGRYLYRHLRFNYPTFMFGEAVMEVNEEGIPYWICPRIEKTIGLFGGTDVTGAVLVNAITGECQYYETADVPSWVDNLYNADLIMKQYDYYGMYHNGFINSIFGQRDVTITTQGYNYLTLGDDVYMYTGVTSVGGDQSNVGFLLTNQRTKESNYYSCAGATEYSAMASANGELQNLRYEATFPLLLNVGGEPTYFMAMKDAAQLVKKYAMVNVQQYQIVATGDTVAECERKYLDMLERDGILDGSANLSGTETVDGTVADIRTAVMGGNSIYYISLIGNDTYYAISASEQPDVVILNAGDQVTVTYEPGETPILKAMSIAQR